MSYTKDKILNIDLSLQRVIGSETVIRKCKSMYITFQVKSEEKGEEK